MKVKIEKTVSFYEVDQQFVLYPRILLNYFQEAVGIHSTTAKDHAVTLMDRGQAWILSRIGIQIRRWPTHGDPLSITTWHTGYNGFKAFRDFEVECRGESMISARSMWLFIDLNKKKILRIPKTTDEAYTVEAQLPMDMDITTWNPSPKFSPEQVQTIATRPSDYDPLGHVNNALFLDFFHNLIESGFPGSRKPDRVMLQYVKEIPRDIKTVDIGFSADEDGYRFKIFSRECIHAVGRFTLIPVG